MPMPVTDEDNCDPSKELFCKAYDAVIVDRFGGANANHQN